MTKSLPNIALVGYGFMGKEVEETAKKKGFQITDIFEMDRQLRYESKYLFDVAIDFSYPGAVLHNVEAAGKLGKNIVIGTTGWYDKLSAVNEIVERYNIGLIYSSNFSIGMLMFAGVVNFISKIAANYDQYDIFMHEIHHKRKKDTPSGTALMLSDIILKNFTAKKHIENDAINGPVSPEILHLSSTRGGDVTGVHTVYLDSDADTIELTHRAKNRKGFAIGALEAAQWINGKKGIHRFEDVLLEMWS